MKSENLISFISLALRFLIIFLSVGGVILLQQHEVKKKDIQLTTTEYQDQEKEAKLQLNFLDKTPTMGFDNIVADWVYLQFIQYFGDIEAREKTGYSLLPDYFSQVVNHDPLFVDAISQLEVATSLFAALPQESVDLLGKALQSMQPKLITRIEPYYLWRAKGNNELLFLGDLNATKESYAKSIEWAKEYDTDDSQKIIDISQKSIQFLEENPDSKLVRIGAWVAVLSNRPDAKTIERVIQEIEALGGKVTTNPNGQVIVNVPTESN
jgi:hypothetical protein